MSDLISRSEFIKALTEYEEELRRDRQEAIETDDGKRYLKGGDLYDD